MIDLRATRQHRITQQGGADALFVLSAPVFARTMPATQSAYTSRPFSSSSIIGKSLKKRLMLFVSFTSAAVRKAVTKVSRREARSWARVAEGVEGRSDVGWRSESISTHRPDG